ncbi:hypothetical protein BD779DRAFT_1529018 [Infundibulicybe gibba]|nr:hypothetical protein BD779DRAFT_1529018 [Infundibulicybe gibba]
MPEPAHERTDAPAPVPQVEPAAPISMPAYEYHSGHQVWGGPVSLPQTPEQKHREVAMPSNGDANGRSRTPSIHQRPLEDPFADPIAPRITFSHSDEPHLPNPHPYQQAPVTSNAEAHGNIIMPIPVSVGHPRSIQEAASTQSIAPSSAAPYGFDTDETRPLISRTGSPKGVSYLQSPANPNYATVSPSAGPSSAWDAQSSRAAPRLHNLGWIEYLLPDGNLYYVHPTFRAVTDVDLRNGKLLDAVMAYFENHKHERHAPAGVEVWLRDAGSSKRGFVPVRCWVDHKKRSVTFDPLHDANGNGHHHHHHHHRTGPASGEDSLDMEYRYWSFVEAHPAHTSLPLNARAEAMDVLTWAWTDRLLPSNRAAPAPFTQDECQELTTLLRSFDSQGDAAAQTVVHTRFVSRILLRVAQWRQQYFRPEKPLPKDAGRGELRIPEHRRPFRRVIVDLLISCVCLGIPYIFFNRNNHHRIDEEGGVRSAAPMLVIGACTCLVVSLPFLSRVQSSIRVFLSKAAIVLSASVTLLSLPGLDILARIAGIVAIVFASFSMVSTIVAIFKCKTDMGRVPHVGGEGLLMLSRRSIILSLPLVFLAYAIAGFVTGIVLYSFRGVTTTHPLAIEHHFNDHTRWTTIGLLGGLAGIFMATFVMLRR